MLRLVNASFFNGPHCHTGHSPVVLRCKGLMYKILGEINEFDFQQSE